MADFDPVRDAIDFLSRKTLLERHSIARLLDVDGPALAVQRWIIEQHDCDLATAAMLFWRLRVLSVCEHLAAQYSLAARSSALDSIVARVHAGHYVAARIAWDGREVWTRVALIGAPPLHGMTSKDEEVTVRLSGPFGTTKPEPAMYAFFDRDYGDDDLFDSLWRVAPVYAAASDWLTGKPAAVWMAAADELQASHPDEVYNWMVAQPECPSSVVGELFWLSQPEWHAQRLLEAGRNS